MKDKKGQILYNHEEDPRQRAVKFEPLYRPYDSDNLMCKAECSTDALYGLWVCTRRPGHDGVHVAGYHPEFSGSDKIGFVWQDEEEEYLI